MNKNHMFLLALICFAAGAIWWTHHNSIGLLSRIKSIFGSTVLNEKQEKILAYLKSKYPEKAQALRKPVSTDDYDAILKLLGKSADLEVFLYEAAAHGYQDLADFLIKRGSSVKSKLVPLAGAAFGGQNEMIKFLIAKGANINQQGELRQTALQAAVMNNFFETAQLLIELGANVNLADNFGHAPLHIAAGTGNRQIVELLIKHNAQLDAKNHQGKTPVDLAVLNGFEEIEKTLRQAQGER